MTIYANGVQGKSAAPGDRTCLEHPESLNQIVGTLVSRELVAEGERITLRLDGDATLTMTVPLGSHVRVKQAPEDDYHPRSLPAIVLRSQLMDMAWRCMDVVQDAGFAETFGEGADANTLAEFISELGNSVYADSATFNRARFMEGVASGWE